MSRGLGALQRAILQVYDQAVPQPRGLKPTDPWEEDRRSRYDSRDIRHASSLRHGVVRLRGAWCETECRAPAYRYEQHRPHPNWQILGWGYSQSFSRALHTLVRRSVLLPVTWDGLPIRHVPRYIAYVVRGDGCNH